MKFFGIETYWMRRVWELAFVYLFFIVLIGVVFILFYGGLGLLIAHSFDLGKIVAKKFFDPVFLGTALPLMLIFHGLVVLSEKRKSRKREALKPDWLKELDRERDQFINSIRERHKS